MVIKEEQVILNNRVPIVDDIRLYQDDVEIFAYGEQYGNIQRDKPLFFKIQFNESMATNDEKLSVTIKNVDESITDEEWTLIRDPEHDATAGWGKTDFENDTWYGVLYGNSLQPCEDYKIIISKDTKDLAGNQINPKRDDKPDRKKDLTWNYEPGDDDNDELTTKDVELPVMVWEETEETLVIEGPKQTVSKKYTIRNYGEADLFLEMSIEHLKSPIHIGNIRSENVGDIFNIVYGVGDKEGKLFKFTIKSQTEGTFSCSALMEGDKFSTSTKLKIREAGKQESRRAKG